MYELGQMKKVSGDGVSGLATRSDLARARELERHGLTMPWYDALVESQQNLCGDCHKQEKQKLGNGKRRPLGLGFGEDGQPNRLICTGCASRIRTAKARERKENEGKPTDYASFEDFWKANREKEDPAELAALQERHGNIGLLFEAICEYLNDTDEINFSEDLAATVDEVEAELKSGTVTADILQISFYRADERDFYNHVQAASEIPDAPNHAKATAIFASLGLITQLPNFPEVHTFLKRFGNPSTAAAPATPGWVHMICCNAVLPDGKGCNDMGRHVPAEIAAEYAKKAIKYLCHSCILGNVRAKEQSGVPAFQATKRDFHLYDNFGRTKDFDR